MQDLYSTTSLDYQPTVELYLRCGCQGADLHCPRSIGPALGFLEEKSPSKGSKPCQRDTFLPKNEVAEELGLGCYPQGYAVMRLVQPSREDVVELECQGASEIVLTLNPLTRIDTAEKISSLTASPGCGNSEVYRPSRYRPHYDQMGQPRGARRLGRDQAPNHSKQGGRDEIRCMCVAFRLAAAI